MSIFRYLYKETSKNISDLLCNQRWDYFISAYTDAERIKVVYNSANADKKFWLAFKEYNYVPLEIIGDCFFCKTGDEAADIQDAWNYFNIDSTKSICIDSTGFIRPYLAFLILFLEKKGFKKIDMIYSEPMSYKDKEKTNFSKGAVLEVRQIRGFEGSHNNETHNDILILNSGYDADLISSVAEHKKHTQKYQLIGFPSLRADMYQQCILQVHKAQEAIGRSPLHERYDILAPANDPFITADILKTKIENIHSSSPITNIYLSPLATKAQLIGIVLYYLMGNCPCPISVVFPYSSEYSRETTRGISRIWLYSIEFKL